MVAGCAEKLARLNSASNFDLDFLNQQQVNLKFKRFTPKRIVARFYRYRSLYQRWVCILISIHNWGTISQQFQATAKWPSGIAFTPNCISVALQYMCKFSNTLLQNNSKNTCICFQIQLKHFSNFYRPLSECCLVMTIIFTDLYQTHEW